VIEFIERLNALDILLILLWLGAVVYGVTTGVVRQFFMIGSMLVGAVIGAVLAAPLSIWTGPMSGAGREAILPFTFSVLVILSALVVYILVIRSYPHTRLVRTPALDGFLGGIAGVVTGVIVVSLAAVMLDITTRGQWAVLEGARANVQAQLTNGPLVPWISSTFPLLAEGIARVVPQA
jgi:uncharacterized membrane protein required for colicin V production